MSRKPKTSPKPPPRRAAKPAQASVQSTRPPKKSFRLLLLLIPAVVLIGGGGALLAFALPGAAPGDGSRTLNYEVRPGVGAYTVAKELQTEGMIASADWFRMWLRITGQSGAIKVGVYELNDGMSAQTVAAILTEGRVRLTALTIPEGWNHRQIGDYLAEKGFVEDREEWLRISRDPEVRTKYGIPDDTTEGYLFPDTYMVAEGTSAERIHVIMIEHFFEILEEVAGTRKVTPDIRKRILLASIVEREAVRPEERPLMAQVFLNRLERNMRLESCATIQYLFEKPRRRLYEKDLQIPSPYNTYRNAGLPPGPISNPGRAAIEAAFEPKPSDFLFFVLKPDGSHHFSATYAEHLNAKKKYIDS